MVSRSGSGLQSPNRTCVNVYGDACVAAVVDYRAGVANANSEKARALSDRFCRDVAPVLPRFWGL